MSLTYNNVHYELSSGEHSPMDVYSFISYFRYDIDRLYVDRFWNNIEQKSWIIIDYAMLRWMGYDSNRERDNKQKYINILLRNFTKGEDFDEVNTDDLRNRVHMGADKL